jgi:hypothetical protein
MEPQMHIPTLAGRTLIAAATALLLAPALPATQSMPPAQPVPTAVEFAPAAAAKMRRYGESERATLTSAIVSAVSRQSSCAAVPGELTVAVTVQDVASTRPTLKQQTDNPTLDPVRTKYLGGAALSGEVRDASHNVVTRVSYRYFPFSLPLGSVSVDPWADARLAIEGFAAKLARACRDLGRRGTSAAPTSDSR